MVRWYIINQNNEEINQKKESAPGQFSYIQSKVWSLMIKALEGKDIYAPKINKILVDYIKNSVALNKTNRYLGVLLRGKVFKFI